MTTQSLPRPRNYTVLLLCAVVAVLFVLPALNTHSLVRHGNYAIETYQQICKQGPEATFQRDNRLIHCVRLDDGHYGAVVVEADCQGIECLVTAFKSRYTELSDFVKYMLRTGAIPK